MGTRRPLPPRRSKGKGTEKAFDAACDLLDDEESPTAFIRSWGARSSTILITDRRILLWSGAGSVIEFPTAPATAVKKVGLFRRDHLVAGDLQQALVLTPANLELLIRALGQPASTEPAKQLGARVAQERLASKTVIIYQNGFVRVSGLIGEGSAERLLSITASADITKKTGLGRGVAGAVTLGVSLLGPNMRGDVYLVIVTDRTTHTLHSDMPDAAYLKKVRTLEAAGLAVLAQKATTEPVSAGPAAAEQKSIAEQLREMKALVEEGVITQEDFEKFKAGLLD